MKKRNTNVFISIVLAAFLAVGIAPKLSAAEDCMFKQAITDDETVKAYIRTASSTGGVSYQIGNIATDEPREYPISDDEVPVRTLIMVDNSFSVPENSRTLIKEAIKQIIDVHAPNETFRFATFSEDITYLSDEYSSDYTALKNVADSIEHKDQETYLTDVLYDVINEFNAEKYEGYTRIVIFSDGVDNKPIGVTREELNKKLDESPYPVYTFGSKNGKNDSELENMFALSRLTGCEYAILEEASEGEIAGITALDNEIKVFEVDIPEEAKIGGKQSSKLTFSNGSEVVFSVNMPFSIKETKEEVEPESEMAVEPTAESEEKKVEKPVYTPQNGIWAIIDKLPKWAIPAAAGGVLLIIIIILAIVMTGKSKKKKQSVSVQPQPVMDYEKTVMMSEEVRRSDNATILMTPDQDGQEIRRYRFALTDAADSARSFRCELISEIRIGRQPDNNIVLSDDTAVHGHHASVSVKNDTFYFTDLKDVKNHSAVNGIALKPEIPQLIVNNSKVTIGRHTYVISITQ
ncbi:MAG: FHA domain-containing protein [Butyrivibrio sp.]|nr:FHA domain-containing protein [Butyrivibrio sp.]